MVCDKKEPGEGAIPSPGFLSLITKFFADTQVRTKMFTATKNDNKV